jgi:hypothetical protein
LPLIASLETLAPEWVPAYFLTAAIVRGFSLSKRLRISRRCGQKRLGPQMSSTSPRHTRVAAGQAPRPSVTDQPAARTG